MELQDLINEAIIEYNSFTEYSTTVMNMAHPSDEIVLKFLPYIKKACRKENIKHAGGNYYKHSFPYLPHTDYEKKLDNTINVVIPLWYDCEIEPYLIVFDQVYNGFYPVTWMMNNPVYTLFGHTAVLGYPQQYNLTNDTNALIDENLYEYIKMYPKEMLNGLSGKAYKFEPGNIIVFDNRQVHCTSNYTGTKLGLSLRFKEF